MIETNPKILRVFPHRTNATPDDELVRIGHPDMLDPPEGIDEIHISVTFTWDLDEAKRLHAAWMEVRPKWVPVLLGGPACGDPGGDFIPGRYLKPGHVITTRGCPHNCWFCQVPPREGHLRTLPVEKGHIIHDSNLLAAPWEHFDAVCQMLEDQNQRAVFAGGLDTHHFTAGHAARIAKITPRVDRMYFAYDSDDQKKRNSLIKAGRICREHGFTRSHHLYAYVLVGQEHDTPEAAEARCRYVWNAGFVPFPMPYRDERGAKPAEAFYRVARLCGYRPAIARRYLSEVAEFNGFPE